MPYLKIETNMKLEEDTQVQIMREVAQIISKTLNKPDKYVMVAMESSLKMFFSNSPEPTVFMELMSIELPQEKIETIINLLSDFIESSFHISKQRAFIIFSNINRSMWAWNSKTF